jgi:hypothetical protein
MSGLFAFGWSGSVLVDFVRRINLLRDAVDATVSTDNARS